MCLAEIIKNRIAERLAGFLISEKTIPEKITLTVNYPLSIARLNIDISDIQNDMKKENWRQSC